MNHGRVHLPVSPACNIGCRFCSRAFSSEGERPGRSRALVRPDEAVALVRKALELCPDITVAGIAGPGDTLATRHALDTFERLHSAFPALIKCLSTNGLLLERYAADLYGAGVRTLTVTVNAVEPAVLARICSFVVLDGVRYGAEEGASILIEAQQRGIALAARLGMLVKINTVLVPGVNTHHIGAIADSVKASGAEIINILPLIPANELADCPAPTCTELAEAREAAERRLPVFRHCKHCRADACGIPGGSDVSALLYGGRKFEETFSHG
jgi:nitrogen fixation protein NifB